MEKYKNKNRNIKYLLMPILMLFIIFIGLGIIWIVLNIQLGVPSKESIINKFIANKEMFYNSYEELANMDDVNIYFYKSENSISISIHEHNGTDVKITKVEEESYYLYKETINLMKELDLEIIYREDGVITICMPKFGQKIISTSNVDEYPYLIEYQHIKDKWYYVRTK